MIAQVRPSFTILTSLFLLAAPAFCGELLKGTVNEKQQLPAESQKHAATSLGRIDLDSATQAAAISPEKQQELAWDAWHKRLAETIYNRFDFVAQQRFKDSPPLAVKVRYVVTKDGRIVGLKVVEKSADMLFDALACQVVTWVSHKPDILKFPDGSTREYVEKFATFKQNFGDEGYQYSQGDKESVRE